MNASKWTWFLIVIVLVLIAYVQRVALTQWLLAVGNKINVAVGSLGTATYTNYNQPVLPNPQYPSVQYDLNSIA
jgi:hypothetical protein